MKNTVATNEKVLFQPMRTVTKTSELVFLDSEVGSDKIRSSLLKKKCLILTSFKNKWLVLKQVSLQQLLVWSLYSELKEPCFETPRPIVFHALYSCTHTYSRRASPINMSAEATVLVPSAREKPHLYHLLF